MRGKFGLAEFSPEGDRNSIIDQKSKEITPTQTTPTSARGNKGAADWLGLKDDVTPDLDNQVPIKDEQKGMFYKAKSDSNLPASHNQSKRPYSADRPPSASKPNDKALVRSAPSTSKTDFSGAEEDDWLKEALARKKSQTTESHALASSLEGVINDAIKQHQFSNNLLTDAQFGFRQGHSAHDLIIAMDQTWTKELNSRGEALHWLESYLAQRKMIVVIKGQSTPLHDIAAGVPQGGVLSSTIFNCFINDLATIVSSPFPWENARKQAAPALVIHTLKSLGNVEMADVVEEVVLDILRCIKVDKSPGTDQGSPRTLWEARKMIAGPLAEILVSSIVI
eukprot:g41296.t1